MSVLEDTRARKQSYPRTPQPRRTHNSNKDFVHSTISQIEETKNQIATTSKENAAAHANGIKLQHNLSAVTKAHSKNIDVLQALLKELKDKNEQLHIEYESRREMHEKVQELLDKCSNAGVDIDTIPNLDHDQIREYFDVQQPMDEFSKIDPIVKHICEINPYFKRCTSNEEFIKRVSEMHNTVHPEENKPQEDSEREKRLSALRAELARLQLANAQAQAKRAAELGALLDKREILMKQLNNIERYGNARSLSRISSRSTKPSPMSYKV